jgi:acyl-CoA thioesterase-1
MPDRRVLAAALLVLLAGIMPLFWPEPMTPLPRVEGRAVRVAFLGDSLTAGYGLRRHQAFPILVGAQLEARGLAVEVLPHGVSGDTAGGGLSRVEAVLSDDPDLVLVALGVNDGAQRRAVGIIKENLRAIAVRLREAGVGVAFAGMEVPPLVTPPGYASEFRRLYPALTEELRAPLLPFLLEGIAWKPEWNQKDRVHPTAEGQERIAASPRW